MSASLKRGHCKLFVSFSDTGTCGEGVKDKIVKKHVKTLTLSVWIFSISGCVESLNDCGGREELNWSF